MATGESLRPGRVLDVDLRLHQEKYKHCPEGRGHPYTKWTETHLQSRKLVRDDNGNTAWTEWENVPHVVTEKA